MEARVAELEKLLEARADQAGSSAPAPGPLQGQELGAPEGARAEPPLGGDSPPSHVPSNPEPAVGAVQGPPQVPLNPTPVWTFTGDISNVNQSLSVGALMGMFRPFFADPEWTRALAKFIRYTHFRLQPGTEFKKVWTQTDDRQWEALKMAMERQIYGKRGREGSFKGWSDANPDDESDNEEEEKDTDPSTEGEYAPAASEPPRRLAVMGAGLKQKSGSATSTSGATKPTSRVAEYQRWWALRPGTAVDNYRVSWPGLIAFLKSFDEIMWGAIRDDIDTRPVLRLGGVGKAKMEMLYMEAQAFICVQQNTFMHGCAGWHTLIGLWH